jgi:hypothetical protein
MTTRNRVTWELSGAEPGSDVDIAALGRRRFEQWLARESC